MSPRRAPAPPIRVLIVDDSSRQREGWALLLGSQPEFEVVGQASDGAGALAFARRNPVDVVLMDLHMRRVGGAVAAERIRTDDRVAEQGTPPRVILFATVDLDEQLPAAAEAGAYAALFKDVEPEALFDAIRSAAAYRPS